MEEHKQQPRHLIQTRDDKWKIDAQYAAKEANLEEN